jgi:hypothetical protein
VTWRGTQRQELTRWPNIAEADAFMATDYGQWSIRNGCALAAWEHVAEFRTYPSDRELNRMVAVTQRNQASFDACNRKSPYMGALARFWDDRMERQRKLEQRFGMPA